MSQAPSVSPVDEVIEFFARGPSRKEIAAFELSHAAQERIRALINKNSAGKLTPEEDRELDKMVLLDDIISLIRVRVKQPVSSEEQPSDSPNG